MQELYSVCKTYSWCKPYIVQEFCSRCENYSVWVMYFIL